MNEFIRRYDVHYDIDTGGGPEPNVNGPWVRWEDVEAQQKEQKDILSALLRSSIKVTQALIEEMTG